MALLSLKLAQIMPSPPVEIRPLATGVASQLYHVKDADGAQFVAKVSQGQSLTIEAAMLRYLQEHRFLPVPRVFYSDPQLLLMEHIAGNHQLDAKAQEHAAELLANLHSISGNGFGFDYDTLIGGLDQPNPWSDRWLDFFAEHRLLYMAGEAYKAQQLPLDLRNKLERCAARLHRWLAEPAQSSLIHGDIWSGNVLSIEGRICGFLDPAIYYAHSEIELAFITLFGTFGQPFFHRYHALNPIADGFFEERRHIYNLYPLLVHVRLFGGGYVQQVRDILKRLGF